MNFIRKFGVLLSLAFVFSAPAAFASPQQDAGGDAVEQACGSDKNCLCEKSVELALKQDCLDTPPNPLVDKEHAKGIDEAGKKVTDSSSGSNVACTAFSKQNTDSMALLDRIVGVCGKRAQQCETNCPQYTGAKKSDLEQKCAQTKGKNAQLSSDLIKMKDYQAKSVACKDDSGGEEKKEEEGKEEEKQANKDGGGGGMPQLPQMPQSEKKDNPCAADPTSAQCQQAVQDCSNPDVYSKYTEFCRCSSGVGASSDPNCNKREVVASEPSVPEDNAGGSYGSGSSDSYGSGETKKKSTDRRPSATGGGGAPMAGGGGGMGGSSGGANTPDTGEAEDDGKLSANILGGAGGGGGGGGGGGSAPGSYSNDGNWIPPGMSKRSPSGLVGKKVGGGGYCDPTKQPSRNNFEQLNWAYICVMHQEPK